MQILLEPAVILVGKQVSEERVGVDHSVKLAACDDAPTVAVIEAVVSALMVPMDALKLILALPTAITTLAGTVMIVEVDRRVTVVLAVAA